MGFVNFLSSSIRNQVEPVFKSVMKHSHVVDFFKNPFKINFVYHKIPHGRFGARKALFKKKEEGKYFQLSSTHSHAAAASFSVRLIT